MNIPFTPLPSAHLLFPSFRTSRSEGNPKNSSDQDRRELKSRSFDLIRVRETGESLRALTRARAYNPRVRARACYVHPRALQTLVLVNVRGFVGFGSAVPGRLCMNEVQAGNRGGDWKRRQGGKAGGGGFLWRPKWSLALAVITRAKEIKSGTKTRISERREKTER